MLYLFTFIFNIKFSARASRAFTVFAASLRRSLLLRNFDTKKPVKGIGEMGIDVKRSQKDFPEIESQLKNSETD